MFELYHNTQLKGDPTLPSGNDSPVEDYAVPPYDMIVDEATRSVKRGNRDISLTGREFDLLMVLVEHSGAVVNRAAILQQLFEKNPEFSSNLVDVYIRRLRKKIDEGASKPLIITEWGKGYRMRGVIAINRDRTEIVVRSSQG